MMIRNLVVQLQSGSWRGSVEYVIDHTTPGSGVNLTEEPFFEEGSGLYVRTTNLLSRPD